MNAEKKNAANKKVIAANKKVNVANKKVIVANKKVNAANKKVNAANKKSKKGCVCTFTDPAIPLVCKTFPAHFLPCSFRQFMQEEEGMFCAGCGARFIADARFCEVCGLTKGVKDEDNTILVMIVKQTFGLVSKGFNLQKPRATYTSQNGVFTERVR